MDQKFVSGLGNIYAMKFFFMQNKSNRIVKKLKKELNNNYKYTKKF
jgi:formamidopyrimidine-DNA glycosylase